jgi:BlaI family transcriptional regulator, penicillinase repressor
MHHFFSLAVLWIFQLSVDFSTWMLYGGAHAPGGRMVRTKPQLSRREQEILDIVYARAHATAVEVREAMHDAPTDAAVRTTLRILVAKGHLRIEQDGPRYDYWPTVPPETARRSELQHVLRTFFGGSTESALATLLDIQPGGLSDDARRRLKHLIDKAAKEGR